MLASVGGALGVGLAYAAIGVLHRVSPSGIPRLTAVRLDLTALAFTLAVTAVTGSCSDCSGVAHDRPIDIGSAPRTKPNLHSPDRAGRVTRYALIITEMALAVLLLCGAGLSIRSFGNLVHVDPGFSVGEALTFKIGLPDSGYKTDEARLAFFDRARADLAALPGVTGVSLVSILPPSAPQFNLSFEIAGRPKLPPADQPAIEVRTVTGAISI